MRRRNLLILAALPAVAASGPASASNQGTAPQQSIFRNRLRIPPLAESTIDADGARRFALTMRRGRSELLPGTWTETLGFNGPYLGPTIRLRRGETVRMVVTNHIGEVSTVHWHGLWLPARVDGGPHQPIEPGATWTPRWTIDQPAGTFWYHPHWQGSTAQQVYRGLAGLLLVDEPNGPDLPDTYGVDDIPLILQDKRFAPDGTLVGDPRAGTFGVLGDHVLVNGTHQPYLDVTTERVRFRLLNGSNARMYHVRFADRRGFQVVAADAGLLDTPVEVDEISLTPAERVEIVARFTPGETVVLRSVGGTTGIDRGDFDLMRIVARRRLDVSPLPDWSSQPPVLALPGTRVRRFWLDGHDTINGRRMDLSRIDEVVPAGAREIWEVRNSGYAHSFHIHGVSFRVLEVDGAPPPAHLAGPKDTVYVPGGAMVRLAVRFGHHTDRTAPYMYHCHILRHEDAGMMGQFVVVEPGTEDQVPRRLAPGTSSTGVSH